MRGQGGPSTGSWCGAQRCSGLGRSRALHWLSPSPRFIAEPQPCAKPSLSLPPRRDAQPQQVWPPLWVSAAMEPALSHWLLQELFMLQLAPNTLVYEEKMPGTMRYLLHLPSFSRPRQAGVPGQGCTHIPCNTHSIVTTEPSNAHPHPSHTHTWLQPHANMQNHARASSRPDQGPAATHMHQEAHPRVDMGTR